MKLSPAQRRVLGWMGRGWRANTANGAAVTVNGARVCNLDTMEVLLRRGLVQREEHWGWTVTPRGRDLCLQLDL